MASDVVERRWLVPSGSLMYQGELAHCMVVWYGMVLLLMGIKVPGDERVYCI